MIKEEKAERRRRMEQYYLAVDIGASSGRHMLAHLENGTMKLEEIYRFPNGMIEKNEKKCWDVEALFGHIIKGMQACKEAEKIPVSMGIDTWAVDFVLLDENEKMLGDAVAYRDSRTSGMDKNVYKAIPEEELYARTGIQKQIFNTIYQLEALKETEAKVLSQAKSMLMIPEYFHFLLTQKMAAEYTNATTTQLVNPDTKDWDYELIERLGFPREIFQKIRKPGSRLGGLKKEIVNQVGFDCQVVLPATHDTASAVMSVPAKEEQIIYISSGTWSLMGTELLDANTSKESREKNLTNEGGYDYRFRYLKNIMGLWMIQSVRKEIAPELDFAKICEMAEKEDIASVVDCNSDRFLAPENMTQEIRKACEESNQQIPEGIAQIAAVIYHSLAKCYGKTIEEIERLTQKSYDTIHVVGGGANAGYLNELTARETKRTVLAGPTEATAIGNIAAQMIAAGELKDLKEARECIYKSFDIQKYEA